MSEGCTGHGREESRGAGGQEECHQEFAAKTKEMSSPKTAKIRVFVKWRYRESFTRLRLIRRVLVV